MFSPRSLTLLTTALCAVLPMPSLAAPAPLDSLSASNTKAASYSTYWVSKVTRQGTVFPSSSAPSNYTIFRDVTTYGAKGDGVTDDTAAINRAISDGGRCGFGCNSSTTTPAMVYFPPGTYSVSTPIQMYYYTQVIGDAVNMPTIKASSSFAGMAVMDSDPYTDTGANWYINQNNFFRQVRNFNIDLTDAPDAAAGIHWQVAQATSLQNIVFNMANNSQQTGIFMDNGSGGFFGNLTFIGGNIGAFLGNQQFTTRNLKFENCNTAVYMNWNWGWTLSGLDVNNCGTALNISSNPGNQTVGSVLFTDSKVSNTDYGVLTAYDPSDSNTPATGGTLVIDNVDMTQNVGTAIHNLVHNSTILATLASNSSWAQGNGYSSSSTAKNVQASMSSPKKSPLLLDANKNIFGRIRPQYEDVSVQDIKSAKASGCHGDGEQDDTANVQNFLNNVAKTPNAIAYFDHGAYLITDTITVPDNIKITGECWPYILADSKSFSQGSNPKAVFQVGSPSGNSTGSVEISDIIFETNGPAPNAIMVEWNLQSDQGQSGMWDSHVRVGGSAGTNLQSSQCPGDPTTNPSPHCYGVFLMFHATPQSSGVYLENTWFWVADHDMESQNQTQISIYSGRGTLIQSKGPVWLWGTASEHSLLYNYQLDGVDAFYGGFMQSETPYYQPNPVAPNPFTINSAYDDPTFSTCGSSSAGSVPCQDAWGLRVLNSTNVLIYGTGFYSFFQSYSQSCVGTQSCQENMIEIQNSQVDMYTVTTKAAVNMLIDGDVKILDADNRDTFGATFAYYHSQT